MTYNENDFKEFIDDYLMTNKRVHFVRLRTACVKYLKKSAYTEEDKKKIKPLLDSMVADDLIIHEGKGVYTHKLHML